MVLRVVVPVAEVDAASDALWVAGASAVGEEARPDGVVVLTADLDRCPPTLASCAHDVFDDDGSWRDGWRPFARASVARPFLVRPPWVEADAAGFVELLVDGGHAFGTGSHPSTTLALEALASRAPLGSVLDAGCGSGVLAVGAALLGAERVVAVDLDPAAIEACVANAARNHVEVEVVACGIEEAPTEPFDVVVANLGSPLVVDLAGELTARCRRSLILSGMLGVATRTAQVPAAFPDFDVVRAPERDGWRALVLARR
jgi:ribosomal protein L11 methyltransferase